MDVAGRPLLWHVLNRLKAAACLDRILLATSNHPADAPLLSLAHGMGIDAFAGDQEDVLDRFYQAALDVVLTLRGTRTSSLRLGLPDQTTESSVLFTVQVTPSPV